MIPIITPTPEILSQTDPRALFFTEGLSRSASLNEQTEIFWSSPERSFFVKKHFPASQASALLTLAGIDNVHLSVPRRMIASDGGIDAYFPYVSGEPLSSLLGREKRLSPERAALLCADIADGLSALHKAGLVHRDINPNNIIAASGGSAVIIDFGILRSVDPLKTTDTVILGTPGYAAPEQFGFTQSDSRTDVYALGVLLNVLLTGTTPEVSLTDSTLAPIVKKSIALDPGKRYADVLLFRDALLYFLDRGTKPERFLSGIPGFRDRKPLKMAAAFFGYLLFILLSIPVFLADYGETIVRISAWCLWLFVFVIPFVLSKNMFNIWDKLPIARGAGKQSKKIVYRILAAVSVIIGIILLVVFAEIRK